jgi:thioredoxin 2
MHVGRSSEALTARKTSSSWHKMSTHTQQDFTLVCTSCQSVNRVPPDRISQNPICGKCKLALLPDCPIELTEETFQKFVSRTSLPILVDFWAPWCNPCRMMAPAFAQAAQILNPNVLLAKVNTEVAQQVAGSFGIQSIPTLVLLRAGREVDRQSGAMSAQQIVQWMRSR